MNIEANGMQYKEIRENLIPIKVVDSHQVEDAERLLTSKAVNVTFQPTGWTCFHGVGSYVVLDFGKELCGGIRIITQSIEGCGRWRLTFGESLTEAYSTIGEKNATNDHSPRDFEVITNFMSDLQFGQTGFRFVRIELLQGAPAVVQNIFAVSHLPDFEQEAEIVTNDELLNRIIKTAAYTLKLNFQHGHIWDGIKRDRLVWCGDLHPEILTSLYLFGDNEHIKNSLRFLRDSTPRGQWINTMPPYSAWWIINVCDYCKITGNWEFFKENREDALEIIEHFNSCINDDGELVLAEGYFLDWSTLGHPDAYEGVCSLVRWMAQKFIEIEENESCRRIIDVLSGHVDIKTTEKPVRAFQILAGRNCSEEDAAMLQEQGAFGYSTFMAYYILTASSMVKGEDMLEIIKTYYGSMLERGATSFWEDFDMEWLENSGRIDEIPQAGQKDIHGDFGRHCYQQFRHSLCHGWSAGVLAFIVEYILGIRIFDGGDTVCVKPHLMGLTDVKATIPLKTGVLKVSVSGDDVQITAPDSTKVER